MVRMMEESYLPTPAEIRQACREIRAGWSDDERHSRTQRTPPMQRSDFESIHYAATIKREEALVRQRDAMAGAV